MKAFGDWKQMMKYIDTNVQSINNSKIFAGHGDYIYQNVPELAK